MGERTFSTENVLGEIRAALAFFGENPYIQALLVIFIFLVAAKTTDLLMTRVLLRIALRTQSKVDDRIVALLHRPVFATVVLLGLLFAFLIVSPSEYLSRTASNLVATVVIVLWAIFAVRCVTLILTALTQDEKRFQAFQPATRPLFETAFKLIILALGVYFVLVSWGVDPVGWLATAGIAAVAIGLAAQETLGNLIAGISILADAPYKVGDYIVLDGQDRGRVTRIGLRSTRILTRDDVEVNVPNSMVARSKIVNETAGRWIKQRLRIPVGVAYGSDVDQVKRVLLGATLAQSTVCRDPEAWVKFDGFGDSSLNFEIRCWIEDPALRGRVNDAVYSAAYKMLAEHGIEIPFPKRDLYIKELPEGFRPVPADPEADKGPRSDKSDTSDRSEGSVLLDPR